MKRSHSSLCLAFAAFLALTIAGPILAQTPAGPATPAQGGSFLDETEPANRNSSPSDFDPTKTLVRVVLVMVLLSAVLTGGLVLFQRISRRGLKFGSESRPLRMVDRLVLGPKSSVCLVQTCGKIMVLGVSDGDISVLMDTDITSPSDNAGDFAKAFDRQSKSLSNDNGTSSV